MDNDVASFLKDSSGASNQPAISFRKKDGLFVLTYQGPKGFGQQSFAFDGYAFNYAFSKGKNSFEFFFFDNFYSNATKRTKLCFSLFSITPTVLFRAMHQNKKVKRKIILKRKLLDSERKKRSSSIPNVNTITPPFSVDKSELARVDHNLSVAVNKAASSFDLAFFDLFLSAYNEKQKLLGKPPLQSKKAVDNLLKSFNAAVVSKQKEFL